MFWSNLSYPILSSSKLYPPQNSTPKSPCPQSPEIVFSDDQQLVNLITELHAGRFVGSFWDVQRNENKKRTKAEVSSAAEEPKKKQKKEKKKENAEGNVATEEATIAALKKIMITLDNISRKVNNYDGRFEMVYSRLIVYDSDYIDFFRDISNIGKNIGDKVKAVMSVNSPPPTADKTHAKDSGVKMSLAEQVAKANAKVAKATEVKNNLVKDFGLEYGRGCRGKPIQREDEEVSAKKNEASELERKQAELKKQKTELKKQKAAELKKQKAPELKKQKAAELKKQKAAELKKQKVEVQKDAPEYILRRKSFIEDDSELADVTDDHSDVEEKERIRSARIKFYWERAMPAAVAPSARVFPYIGDNRTTCMRKDIEPTAEIYDPIEPADPVKIYKLMKHQQPFEKIPLKEDHKDIGFYRILITERPWPDLEYGWLYQNQFKLKPSQLKFKGTGYEELVNCRILVDVQTNLKWLKDVDHLNGVINIRGDHWVGFDMDLLKEKIDCYNTIIGHVT
ncbi:hypothetical protein N665_0110s0012 [Sinapis alba]|nr:hypothetical protein N665_0110s0012 [Sinapis alba]